MRRILALAILLAASTAIAAEPPKLSAPATAAVAADDVGIAVGRSFTVPLLIGSKDAANIAFVERVSDRTQLRVVYVRADGTLGFVVYGISRQDGPGPDPKPDPQPDPKPDPKPDPLPVPTVLWGVVIEETAARTPEQAEVMLSQKTRALFQQWQQFDPTNDKGEPNPVPPGLQPYVDRAKGQPLPQFYVVDDKGRVYSEGPLLKTVADIEALVAKIKRGGK